MGGKSRQVKRLESGAMHEDMGSRVGMRARGGRWWPEWEGLVTCYMVVHCR